MSAPALCPNYGRFPKLFLNLLYFICWRQMVFSQVTESSMYLNYAVVNFQSNADLKSDNQAYVIAFKNVLAFEVWALKKQFKCLTIQYLKNRPTYLFQKYQIADNPDKQHYIGRVQGQVDSFVFGYLDTIKQNNGNQENVNIFCGLIKAFGQVYHLQKISATKVIMFKEKDVTVTNFLASLGQKLEKFGFSLFGLDRNVASKAGKYWTSQSDYFESNKHHTVKRNLKETFGTS